MIYSHMSKGAADIPVALFTWLTHARGRAKYIQSVVVADGNAYKMRCEGASKWKPRVSLFLC